MLDRRGARRRPQRRQRHPAAFLTVEVSALPLDMPAQAEVDLAVLDTVDRRFCASGDIPLPAGATILTDPEEMVARIDVPRGAIGVDAEEEEPVGSS